jgi:hypothetical protein
MSDSNPIRDLSTEEYDHTTVVAAALEFVGDMSEIGRTELVEEVRRFRDD